MVDDIAHEFDLAWSDPALEVALWALVRGEVQPALDLLGGSHADADRRELYVEVLGKAGERRLTDLRQYVDRDPGDADRWLLFGSALCSAAWTARGADRAENTTMEQFGGLIELTEQAREALQRVTTLAPDDPVAWSVLQNCAHGVPEYDGEHQKLFEKAIAIRPLLFSAHVTMLSTLTRKWYGSQRLVLEFARERTAALPPGHPLHALTAYAHIEGYLDGAMRGTYVTRVWRVARYFKDKNVRAEIDAGSAQLLASDAYADHPRYIAAQQAFAMLYHHAQDEQRSAPHLRRSGPRPARWPWAYFGDPATEFSAARRAAGLPA